VSRVGEDHPKWRLNQAGQGPTYLSPFSLSGDAHGAQWIPYRCLHIIHLWGPTTRLVRIDRGPRFAASPAGQFPAGTSIFVGRVEERECDCLVLLPYVQIT